MEFSFLRFTYLFTKQWRENKKAYALSLIALPILMAAILLIIAYTSNLTEQVQDMSLTFGLVILGGIFCSTLLSSYTPKAKGIRSLTLPVTALEKLLVAVIYGLIIFPAVYLLIIYPVLAFVNYVDFEIFGNLNLLATFTPKVSLPLLFICISIFAFVLLCSLFYRKLIFIKAALSIICLYMILTFSNYMTAKLIFGNDQPTRFSAEYKQRIKRLAPMVQKANFELDSAHPFSSVEFDSDTYGSFYINNSKSMNLMALIFSLSFLPLTLLVCFFKLKEMEL